MNATRPAILCLNLGSSSLKYAAFDAEREPSAATALASETIPLRKGSLNGILESLEDRLEGTARVVAIGHRVVLGGETHVEPEPITEALLAELERLSSIAPLHLPPEIAAIRESMRRFPGVTQVACFDTAFHARMPALAKRLPLPRALADAGVRRYGFHGLSYEYVVATLGEQLAPRTIVAHLGGGCSLAAIRDGLPVDTTMGFSALGGVMMETRTGDLDPGIVLYLLRHGYDVRRLELLLEERSGLLGVSQSTGDMASLLLARDHDIRAAEAIDLFVYGIRKAIGALTMTLGGLEMLAFTGGIGEHAAAIREAVLAGIAPLTPRVAVVATNENLMIARHTYAIAFREPSIRTLPRR